MFVMCRSAELKGKSKRLVICTFWCGLKDFSESIMMMTTVFMTTFVYQPIFQVITPHNRLISYMGRQHVSGQNVRLCLMKFYCQGSVGNNENIHGRCWLLEQRVHHFLSLRLLHEPASAIALYFQAHDTRQCWRALPVISELVNRWQPLAGTVNLLFLSPVLDL